MAICTICGESAGLQKTHPDCERRLQEGSSSDDVRGQLRKERGSTTSSEIYRTASSIRSLAGWLFPVFILAGALVGFVPTATRDDGGTVFAMMVGAVVGGFIAALFFTWFKLQALLAIWIAEHLDRR